MRRGVSVALMLALIAAHTVPAAAYLKFGVRVTSGDVTLKWKGTVRYFVSDTGVAGRQPGGISERGRPRVFNLGGRAYCVDCLSVWRLDLRASGRR